MGIKSDFYWLSGISDILMAALPGIGGIASVQGLVGLVSVYCDWVR